MLFIANVADAAEVLTKFGLDGLENATPRTTSMHRSTCSPPCPTAHFFRPKVRQSHLATAIDARREPSPVWQPIYDEGRTVRVSKSLQDLDASDEAWGPARVAYLHDPTDPVAYWNSSLLWRPPTWTSEPIGRGVSPSTRWFPIVTFRQVVADLIAEFSTEPGFWPNYRTEFIDGWAAVAAPSGWTDDDTARLQEYLEPKQ